MGPWADDFEILNILPIICLMNTVSTTSCWLWDFHLINQTSLFLILHNKSHFELGAYFQKDTNFPVANPSTFSHYHQLILKMMSTSRIPAFTRCLLLFVLCISPLFIWHLFILQLCSFFKAQLTCHLFFKAFPKTHKQKDSSELIYSFSVFMAEMPSWNYLKNVHRSQTVELLILVWWFLAGKIASLPFSISSCIKWRYYN